MIAMEDNVKSLAFTLNEMGRLWRVKPCAVVISAAEKFSRRKAS